MKLKIRDKSRDVKVSTKFSKAEMKEIDERRREVGHTKGGFVRMATLIHLKNMEGVTNGKAEQSKRTKSQTLV